MAADGRRPGTEGPERRATGQPAAGQDQQGAQQGCRWARSGLAVGVMAGQLPQQAGQMVMQPTQQPTQPLQQVTSMFSQVGFVDFSDRGRPDYASELRLCVDYMFAMLAWRCDTRWCRGAGRDVGPADQRAALGSARRASRSAIRRSWKRRLERAALSRSSRVRLSAVSWRTRCLRVVFSVVIALDRVLGPFGFQVADAAEEFADPGPLGEDLGWAVLSASSALSARSRQVASRASSCLSRRRSALGGGLPDGFGDSGFRVGVGVEEGPGDVGSTGDRGDADRCLVPRGAE